MNTILGNNSEMQLQSFLSHVDESYTTLSLRPQGDNTIIEKDAVNICIVHNKGKDYYFGGISEYYYDRMVARYDWRENEVKAKHLFK